jgi:hypothetical protein
MLSVAGLPVLMVERVTGIEPASRAWKARPFPSSGPVAALMPQVRASLDQPLLSVSDRQLPRLWARGGHGRRVPTALQRGGDGHKLNRRVRPVQDDHRPRWQAATGGAAGGAEYGPAGWPDGWTGFRWGVAVAAGRAAPAARRWQTGLGSALSGGPVPTRRARSATGAAAGRLAHQPGSQPADYRPPGGVPLVGRSHRDRRAPTLRGAVGPDRHPRAPSCLAC